MIGIKRMVKQNLIGLLFTILGVKIILYSLLKESTNGDLIFISLSSILFFVVYNIIDCKKRKGAIIYIALFLIILIGEFYLIFFLADGSIKDYTSWITDGSYSCNNTSAYNIGTIILVTFFFSTLCYYFTVKYIRMPILLFSTFIIITVYIKATGTEGKYYIDAYISTFFLAYIQKNIMGDGINKKVIKISVIPTIIIGGIIVGMMYIIGINLAQKIEFPEIKPINELRDFTSNLTASTIFNGYSVENNDTDRHINMSQQKNKDYVVYSYNGNYTKYLIKKVYDYFDTNENRWIRLDNGSVHGDKTYDFPIDITLNRTKKLISEANNLNSGLYSIKEAVTNKDYKMGINIKSRYGRVSEMPHPPNVYLVSSNTKGKRLVLDKFDEIINADETKFNIGQKYNEYYVMDEPTAGSQEDAIMRYFNDKRYDDLLKLTGQTEDEEYVNAKKVYSYVDYLSYFSNNYVNTSPSTKPNMIYYSDENGTSAKYYFSNINKIIKFSPVDGFRYDDSNQLLEDKYVNSFIKSSGMSERFLAYKLTKGKESYYDKAMAILNYLKSPKYKYSLKLDKPGKNEHYDIDYFLFKSKKGYCVQYATAMTFLCRAAGMPAKYVEGYLVTDEDKTANGYNVNAKRAHAFTEVYIPGYGWKIFDATPGISQDTNKKEQKVSSTEQNQQKKVIYVIPTAIIIIFSGGVIYSLIYKLTERKRKISRILKKPLEQSLEDIISDIISLLRKMDFYFEKEETLLMFSERVEKSMNIGFFDVVKEYYKITYAGSKIEKQIIQKAIIVDKLAYEKTRKGKK